MAVIGLNATQIDRLLALQVSNGNVFSETDTYVVDSITHGAGGGHHESKSYRYVAATNELIEKYDGKNQVLGVAEYFDTQYTQSSPLTLLINTDTLITNDGLAGERQFAPPGIDLYNPATSKVSGRKGDSISIMVEFTIERPVGNGQYDLESWWDIGGQVRYLNCRRVRDLVPVRGITDIVQPMTLEDWEINGAQFFLRASLELAVSDIKFTITRTVAGTPS